MYTFMYMFMYICMSKFTVAVIAFTPQVKKRVLSEDRDIPRLAVTVSSCLLRCRRHVGQPAAVQLWLAAAVAWNGPAQPHSTVHRSHTLIPPLHSPQVSYPHSPTTQSTGLIPSFPHYTVHRSHTLIPPLHSPHVSYPHSQAYVLIPKLFPLTHNVHVQ